MARLILASGSVTRARLLVAAGVPFDIVHANIDEEEIRRSLLQSGCEPRLITQALAEAKALCVSGESSDDLVLAADQVLLLDSRIVNKSASLADAELLLRRLRGNTHELISGVAFAKSGSVISRHVGIAKLRMRRFSDQFLAEYLRLEGDSVLESVGCYRLEGRGSQLFDRIEGDYFTILGLPLLPVLATLRAYGVLRT